MLLKKFTLHRGRVFCMGLAAGTAGPLLEGLGKLCALAAAGFCDVDPCFVAQCLAL